MKHLNVQQVPISRYSIDGNIIIFFYNPEVSARVLDTPTGPAPWAIHYVLGIKEFCEEMDQWLINEHFKNPSHHHIPPYHAVKELLSSKRVSHVKDITEASYKITLFYFYTELNASDWMLCFVFCYYLQLVQEKEGRKPLPLKAEILTCT